MRESEVKVTIFTYSLACIFILAGISLLLGSRKQIPFENKNGNLLAGSISEIIFFDIDGAKQGMLIKSKDAANPVLLYLYGGMPEYILTQKYPTGLEDHFTVFWREQHGS